MHTKIFIVDKHKELRRALKELINHEADLRVCGEAENGRAALNKMLLLKPDIAIVDLLLEDMSGLDLVKKIARIGDRSPAILVISMDEESVHSKEALTAGAKGYLMKSNAAEKVVEAVRTIAKGNTYKSRGGKK